MLKDEVGPSCAAAERVELQRSLDAVRIRRPVGMNRWQLDLLESLRESVTLTEVFDRLTSATIELGFDHFSCGLWAAWPLSNPSIDFSSNAPPAWQLKYTRARFAQRDPTVQHARRSLESLAWTDEVFASCPELAAQARSSGICIGWTQACVNAHGRRGLMTLTRRQPLLNATELREKHDDLRWLATVSQPFVSSLAIRQQQLRIGKLTEREAEVLRWSGDGKTIGETASILAISENTVNFHLKNAVLKLNAVNKTSAVVIALIHGLLAL